SDSGVAPPPDTVIVQPGDSGGVDPGGGGGTGTALPPPAPATMDSMPPEPVPGGTPGQCTEVGVFSMRTLIAWEPQRMAEVVRLVADVGSNTVEPGVPDVMTGLPANDASEGPRGVAGVDPGQPPAPPSPGGTGGGGGSGGGGIGGGGGGSAG